MDVYWVWVLVVACLLGHAAGQSTCDFTWGSYFVAYNPTATAFSQLTAECASYTNSNGIVGEFPSFGIDSTAMGAFHRICLPSVSGIAIYTNPSVTGRCGVIEPTSGSAISTATCSTLTRSVLCSWGATTTIALTTSTSTISSSTVRTVTQASTTSRTTSQTVTGTVSGTLTTTATSTSRTTVSTSRTVVSTSTLQILSLTSTSTSSTSTSTSITVVEVSTTLSASTTSTTTIQTLTTVLSTLTTSTTVLYCSTFG